MGQEKTVRYSVLEKRRAKVRTRRYFYANTKLAGHSFDYLANPFAILKGNLIIGGGVILYSASDFFHPGVKISIAVAIGLVFPFLIYKSLRFYAHNSAFRNIRFLNLNLAKDANTYEILSSKKLIVTKDRIGILTKRIKQ